jgi:hypothetical protein
MIGHNVGDYKFLQVNYDILDEDHVKSAWKHATQTLAQLLNDLDYGRRGIKYLFNCKLH